jgi:hypothetical protein
VDPLAEALICPGSSSTIPSDPHNPELEQRA